MSQVTMHDSENAMPETTNATTVANAANHMTLSTTTLPASAGGSGPMSYAQALNEAKQVIIQQSNRIKADAEKVRSLQQTITEQSGTILDSERQIRDHEDTIQRQQEQVQALQGQVQDQSTARAQAEAIVDRQGQRLTAMQQTAADMGQKITEMEQRCTEHARHIEMLCQECEALRAQLPTDDDKEALATMAALLTKKSAGSSASKLTAPRPTVTLAEAA